MCVVRTLCLLAHSKEAERRPNMQIEFESAEAEEQYVNDLYNDYLMNKINRLADKADNDYERQLDEYFEKIWEGDSEK